MKWNSYIIWVLLTVVTYWWAISAANQEKYIPHWQAINQTMENSLRFAKHASLHTDTLLQLEVKQSGHSHEGQERIQRAKALQACTDSLMANIEMIKNHLKEMPANALADTQQYLIRDSVAYSVKKALDTYVKWLAKEFKDLDIPKFEPIAEVNKEKDIDFAHTYFEQTTIIGAISILTQKQTVVKRYEAEVLKKLSTKDWSCLFYNDWSTPVAGITAPTQVVQIGEVYTAHLFLAIAPTRIRHQVFLNGQPLEPGKEHTKFTFKVQKKGSQF